MSEINNPVFMERESVSERDVHDLLFHSHDGIELIYVDKGSMFCQTNKDVFRLQKGDICFINRNQLHSLSCDNNSSCCHKTLLLDLKIFNNDSLFDKYIKPLIEDKSFSHVRFLGSNSNAAKIYQDMLEIEQYKNDKPHAYEMGIISRSYDIIKNLYEVYIDKNRKKDKIDFNSELLQKMISYIHENYHEQISLDDIANSVGVSTSTCSRLFKEYTNKTPIVFLNNYRLEKSAQLLRNTNDSIVNISFDCGFLQQSYFNRVFLREYGITPKQYRIQYNES